MLRQLLVVAAMSVMLTGCMAANGGSGSDAASGNAAGKAAGTASNDGDIFGPLPDSFKLGIHLGFGESFLAKRQFGAAEREFQLALKSAEAAKEPDNADIGECLTRLGQTYKRSGRKAEAKEMFKRAHERYKKAENGIIIFTVEKRVWAQGLNDYQELLTEEDDKELKEEISEKWKELREDLGPMEKWREKMTEF